MNRIELLDARYQRSALLARNGVEVVAVGDPGGARVDAAVRSLLILLREDVSALWDDVLGAAKALRWRLATQPQPLAFNPGVRQMAASVATEALRLEAAVDAQRRLALNELAAAARGVVESDPSLGPVLFDAIMELDPSNVVVVGANSAAIAGMTAWLSSHEVRVRSAHQLIRDGVLYEQAYVVGPPRWLSITLTAAPMVEGLSFYLPAWFGDRTLPRSALTDVAESKVSVSATEHVVGDTSAPIQLTAESLREENLVPTPFWIPPDSLPRAAGHDEVIARRVLLSGGYAILLDDGEWIRGIVPSQPGGDRVTHIEVKAVRPGSYLLLREGTTERQALYDAAVKLMGSQAREVAVSQARWKEALQTRFNQLGTAEVMRQLKRVGIKRLDRVRAWVEPTLVRPRSNTEFALLLEWLDIPVSTTYPLADALAKARARASSNIADQLEQAVARADMAALEQDGHLRFAAEDEGFHGWFATRVLEISPYIEIVARNEVRTLIQDRRARWLE